MQISEIPQLPTTYLWTWRTERWIRKLENKMSNIWGSLFGTHNPTCWYVCLITVSLYPRLLSENYKNNINVKAVYTTIRLLCNVTWCALLVDSRTRCRRIIVMFYCILKMRDYQSFYEGSLLWYVCCTLRRRLSLFRTGNFLNCPRNNSLYIKLIQYSS